MGLTQTNTRDGALKTGPVADWASQAEEAHQRDKKRRLELLREGEKKQAESRQQQAERFTAEYREKQRQLRIRKRNKVTAAVSSGYGNFFSSGSGLSGTQRARMRKNEGGKMVG